VSCCKQHSSVDIYIISNIGMPFFSFFSVFVFLCSFFCVLFQFSVSSFFCLQFSVSPFICFLFSVFCPLPFAFCLFRLVWLQYPFLMVVLILLHRVCYKIAMMSGHSFFLSSSFRENQSPRINAYFLQKYIDSRSSTTE
jgi:hypothetical protein